MLTDILAYGAVADGITDSTAAIQHAIDACAAASGGRVTIPAGVFRTYTLSLKTNVELHLEAGAVLRGGDDPLGYPLFEPNDIWRVERAPRFNRRALFYTLGQEHVSITGQGTIDGNAAKFHSFDGIHLSASSDVVVSDCVVHSQDDAFVFRSHQEQLFTPRPLERVAVSNCVCSTVCACFRFGWSGDWLVRDIRIDNVTCSDSWVGLAITLPPLNPENCKDPPRAPELPLLSEDFRKPFECRRIRISNWSCVSTAEPIQLAFGNAYRTEPVAAVRDISLSHCDLEGRGHPVFVVWPENNVGSLHFDDVSFVIRAPTPRKTVPADAVWFDNCDDVTFDRCRWSVLSADAQ